MVYPVIANGSNLFFGNSKQEESLLISVIVLFVAVILIWLLINYVIAKHMERVAIEKGYDEDAHAFSMCFWLGAIGYIYVAMLPNQRKLDQNEQMIRLLNIQIMESRKPKE